MHIIFKSSLLLLAKPYWNTNRSKWNKQKDRVPTTAELKLAQEYTIGT